MKVRITRKWLFPVAVVLLALIAVSVAGCTGSEGPEGPAGPTGPAGPAGPAGPPGSAGSTYVGSDTCAACHLDIAEVFAKSGHPYKLSKVENGQPPEYPFTEVPNPPEGYTWDDITYVIGGYNWKARFIDKDGYIITGQDENATTQYNFANPVVGNKAGWAGYHAGEEQKRYNCGSCHTTGYEPNGNQDGLPGLVGTWSEPGIVCEECHGRGSNHADDPFGVEMKVDRSAEACGACHVRGGPEVINAKGGFIRHHEQYEEFFQSKHRALNCVTCHDPHMGVVQARKAGTDATRIACDSCHFKQAKFQKSAVMKSLVDCIDCHMPRIVKSAVGNADAFTGDIRTHMWAIDPDAVSQFSEDGKSAISQISLDFACRSCHRAGGLGSALTDAELRNEATDYHESN